MTRALVFDQASAVTGWAVGDSNAAGRAPYDFGSIRAPKREAFGERLAFLHATALNLVERYEPDLIGLEQPFFPIDQQRFGTRGAGPSFIPARGFLSAEAVEPEAAASGGGARFNHETVKQLQKVAGCIETIAALYGIPCEAYASASWRKTLLGEGNSRAPKGSDDKWMKRVVRNRINAMGYEVGSDDESDALGILFHALHGPQAAARAQGDLMARIAL